MQNKQNTARRNSRNSAPALTVAKDAPAPSATDETATDAETPATGEETPTDSPETPATETPATPATGKAKQAHLAIAPSDAETLASLAKEFVGRSVTTEPRPASIRELMAGVVGFIAAHRFTGEDAERVDNLAPFVMAELDKRPEGKGKAPKAVDKLTDAEKATEAQKALARLEALAASGLDLAAMGIDLAAMRLAATATETPANA